LDGATLQQRIAAKEFQAYLGSIHLPANFDPGSVYAACWAAPGADGINTFGVDDEQVGRCVEDLAREFDPERRDTLWCELRDRLHRAVQPGVFWLPPVVFAADARLLGVRRDLTVRSEGLRDWSWGDR
jgi:hypothetical protein